MHLSKCDIIQNILSKLHPIANSDVNVLIGGESGTGKEVLAKEIHSLSSRAKKEFISVNCTALPETLLESELFGHKKGSFTGAISDHKGLFEQAEGGTILLDEIGDMPLSVQAKLLRVLQERKIRAIGSTVEKPINFRLISATHRDLKEEVKKGNFREDLFYRLSVVPLFLPPLRNRREDIPTLASKFLSHYANKYNLGDLRLSDEAMRSLVLRDWPGNIRELQNCIERVVVMHRNNEIINVEEIPLDENLSDTSFFRKSFNRIGHFPTVEELTNQYIQFILNQVDSHQGEASKILGLSRRTLYRKLKFSGTEANLLDSVRF